MGMFMPEDIPYRITKFMSGDMQFPFVKQNEIIGTFYIFGKEHKINGPIEILDATNLAKRAITQLSTDIRVLRNSPGKINSDLIRQSYTQRALQISVESSNPNLVDPSHFNKRIAADPTILSNCFVEHITYYKQDYFFELFQPFKDYQVPSSLVRILEGRMLLLIFNVKNPTLLPFEHTLTPFVTWVRKTSKNVD
jgi:hypothetical protein